MLLNRTIDDTLGDTLTGSVPTYDSSWVSSSECPPWEYSMAQNSPLACGLRFNRETTSNRTWHSLVGEGSMSIQFNGMSLLSLYGKYINLYMWLSGSAIYTYFILPSLLHAASESDPVLYKVGVNVSFILDGNVVPNYLQMNSHGVMNYHIPVLGNVSLSEGMHNLTIRNEGTLLEDGSLLRTALVFDFAEYTCVFYFISTTSVA